MLLLGIPGREPWSILFGTLEPLEGSTDLMLAASSCPSSGPPFLLGVRMYLLYSSAGMMKAGWLLTGLVFGCARFLCLAEGFLVLFLGLTVRLLEALLPLAAVLCWGAFR